MITAIILYLNIIAWASAAIKQRHARYFLFFMVLAITDPLNILLGKVLSIHPFQVFFVSSVLLLYAITFSVIKLRWYSLIAAGATVTTIMLITAKGCYNLIIPIALLNAGVLIAMIRNILRTVSEHNRLKVYDAVLLLYQVTMVVKFLIIITQTHNGIIYFYTDSAFEILIGIYFASSEDKKSRTIFRNKEVASNS